MPVSTVQNVTLTDQEEAVISVGPCVVTSIVVTEISANAAAAVALGGKSEVALFMMLGVAAGQTVVWSGEPLAAGSGLVITCMYGAVSVSVGYR